VNRRPLWVSLILIVVIAWGSIAAMVAGGWEPKLGLDLQGGFSVVLAAPEGTDRAVLDQAVETMRNRIESLGAVQEPEISVQGARRILVQLPGVEDRERALAAVGTTGQLTFRPVYGVSTVSPAFTQGILSLPTTTTPPGNTTTTTTPAADATTTTSAGETTTTATTVPGDTTTTSSPPEETTTTTVAPPTTTTLPPNTSDTICDDQPPPVSAGSLDPATGLSLADDPDQSVYLADDGGLVYDLGPAFLTGADLTGAEPGFGSNQAGWDVDPSFTADGGTKFEECTAVLSTYVYGDPHRQMAIVLDGSVISAPSIAQDVAAGESLQADSVVITMGSSDTAQQDAEDLATVLRYGALPTIFDRESEGSVSASLGSDSLRAGLIAGFAGLVLVALALLLYYRILGLIAVLGFTVFGSLLLGTIILLGQTQGSTLTLSGVTGIIVSVGITADSYIVFFERVKEEHRRGRALKPAVDYGFKRAFHTIVTADTVTMAGSILLWLLAIGPVKGFALTLGIATAVDVVVAYYFTRPFAQLLVRSPLGEGGAFSIRGAMGGAIPKEVTP
jgi:preprotein translocase subunit SecD